MKQKRLIILVVTVIAFIVLLAGGYLLWQKFQHDKNQINLIKTANNAYPNDVRYVSFGTNHVFAVPKSFVADETTINGIELLMPGGITIDRNSTIGQLYDSGVVAIQASSDIKPNNSGSLKDYINKTTIPDFNKNFGSSTVKFTMPGTALAATVIAKKDGKTARQLYAYGGSHPYFIVAKEQSDAYVEATSTLIDLSDSRYKDDIATIRLVIKKYVTMLQQSDLVNLYDAGTNSLKRQTSIKDLNNALNDSVAYIHRDIVVPGGGIQNDTFAAQIYFKPKIKEDQPALGVITLKKEDGQWKLAGLQLPAPKKN
ncbi:MAG TPA: hypothetical protein VNX65_00230 [Patescibacteria group bacterium]|jgi:hypothetical protein|nr:hypothetical protein [Patescibacteria group bacterium]